MTGNTLRRDVTITSPHGLHLRPIKLFVELANQYDSEVVVCRGEERINGKSAIHLLTMGAQPGTQLVLEVSGADAGRAIDVLAEALARVFPDD